jgi:hypothetical protein
MSIHHTTHHQSDCLIVIKPLDARQVLPGAKGEGVADRGAGALGGVAA